ncbi:MAG TPA: hypothetical protein VM889_07645 [Candidatus Thermoplasmatota archaeon]|nr:hypothetical protein [Candidatus Thermoplasmatota archaeon]
MARRAMRLHGPRRRTPLEAQAPEMSGFNGVAEPVTDPDLARPRAFRGRNPALPRFAHVAIQPGCGPRFR